MLPFPCSTFLASKLGFADWFLHVICRVNVGEGVLVIRSTVLNVLKVVASKGDILDCLISTSISMNGSGIWLLSVFFGMLRFDRLLAWFISAVSILFGKDFW